MSKRFVVKPLSMCFNFAPHINMSYWKQYNTFKEQIY